MRVTVLIRKLMVLPVMRHPFDRRTLQRERSQRRKAVLQNLRALERSVRQQAVVSYADAQPPAKPMEQDANSDGGPVRVPDRGNGSEMDAKKVNCFGEVESIARLWNRSRCQC